MQLNKRKLFTESADTPITTDLISKAIRLHYSKLHRVYLENEDMYMSNHLILHQKNKADYKPDNRLVINYAKYIVDTFCGFQIGIPVKVTHEKEEVDEYIQEFRKQNDMEDTEYETAKAVDIFGHAFLYMYQDENGDTKVTFNTPMNMMLIHDDSVQERPLFAIRYGLDDEGRISNGEVVTPQEVIPIIVSQGFGVTFGEAYDHPFDGLPIIEVVANEERQGVFDPVKTLINGLNKAASEKANDVDYFADAYLKILGAEVDEGMVAGIRDSRILNLFSDGANIGTLDAAFLEKPSADTTQENLIKLLRDEIFTIAMVSNLGDEDFGNASGTALAFRLQPMLNMAIAMDRKMQSAFNRMYRVLFSLPTNPATPEDWLNIKYTFTRNMPKNVKEEAEVVKLLDGQVSDETKLKILSIIDSPKDELDKMTDQQEASSQLKQQLARNERLTDRDVMENAEDKQVLEGAARTGAISKAGK